jgi:hypothetical protein
MDDVVLFKGVFYKSEIALFWYVEPLCLRFSNKEIAFKKDLIEIKNCGNDHDYEGQQDSNLGVTGYCHGCKDCARLQPILKKPDACHIFAS